MPARRRHITKTHASFDGVPLRRQTGDEICRAEGALVL